MTVTTRVLKCRPSSITFPTDEPEFADTHTASAISLAARHLLSGNPVAFPTETVYGLGALALNAEAASRIYTTKGRPADNPLIVHVSSLPMLRTLVPATYVLTPSYEALMKHFWPGPLTLLFPSDPAVVPSIITAGHPTVAIRMPSHPVARALIAVANAPIAAPSANSSGKPSPTRADHVLRDLGNKVEIILDGGLCDVGVESTVVDGLGEDGNIRVLRPGGVTVEDIERILADEVGAAAPKVLVHRRDFQDAAIESAPTTPGMKYRHYSPSVPVTLLYTSSPSPLALPRSSAADFFASLLPSDRSRPIKVGLMTPSDSRLLPYAVDVDGIHWVPFPLGALSDPAMSAQRLFDGLLTLEEDGVDHILVEEVAENREGLAFMNRIKKAASASRWLEL